MKEEPYRVLSFRLVSNIALAFGVIGTVGSVASIGMQLAPQGIQFFTKLGSNMLRNFAKGPAPTAIADVEGFTLFTSVVTRSITTDITPILEWCEEEYKKLPKIAFDDELDDPDVNAVSLTTTLDICNGFRSTLKPFFKLIGNHLNEVTEELNRIDITDQLTEYVAKTDLVRDDTIDVVYSFINNTLSLSFEDEVVNGLLVFKVYGKVPEEDSVNNGTAKYYIKLTNKTLSSLTPIDASLTITDPGTNKDVTVGGIMDSGSIKSMYFDTPTMNGNVINIPVKNGYKVITVNIEHNSFTRHMSFTVNDIAYTCDIVALKKQIESINQANAANDIDIYATVDEVNNVLVNNYVQKKDLPSPVDMKDYRKKDDLVVPSNTINYSFFEEEPDMNCYTIDNYVEGMRIVGVIHYDTGTDKVFDIKFVNEGNETERYYTLTSEEEICISDYIEGIYMLFIQYQGGANLLFDITSITYGGDELALMPQIDELQQKITALEQQLQATKPYYTWASFYTGYTKVDLVDARTDINVFISYGYNKEQTTMRINHNITSLKNFFNDLLCIVQEDDGTYCYFRISFKERKIYISEIAEEAIDPLPFTTTFYTTFMYDLNVAVPNSTTKQCFKEIYGKYT